MKENFHFCDAEGWEFNNGPSRCVLQTLLGISSVISVAALMFFSDLRGRRRKRLRLGQIAKTYFVVQVVLLAILAVSPVLLLFVYLALNARSLVCGSLIFSALAGTAQWSLGTWIRCYQTTLQAGPSLQVVVTWSIFFVINSVALASPEGAAFESFPPRKEMQALVATRFFSILEYAANLGLVCFGWLDWWGARQPEEDEQASSFLFGSGANAVADEESLNQVQWGLSTPLLDSAEEDAKDNLEKPTTWCPQNCLGLFACSRCFCCCQKLRKQVSSTPTTLAGEISGAYSAVNEHDSAEGLGSLRAFWKHRNPFVKQPTSSGLIQQHSPDGPHPSSTGSVLDLFASRTSSGKTPSKDVGVTGPTNLPVYTVSVTRWQVCGRIDRTNSLEEEVVEDDSSDNEEIEEDLLDVEDQVAANSAKKISIRSEKSKVTEAAESVSFDETQDKGLLSTSAEGNEEALVSPKKGPCKIQYEITVRCSRHGELDWLVARDSAAPTEQSSIWTVWRSPEHFLLLYDTLEIKYGAGFRTKMKRPNFRTLCTSTPYLLHVDISADMRLLASYLRTLLGIRQFLCRELIEFLTPVKSNDGFSTPQGKMEPEGFQSVKEDDNDTGMRPSRIQQQSETDYTLHLKEIAMRLAKGLPEQSYHFRFFTFNNVVPGMDVTKYLIESGECINEESADSLGTKLVVEGILTPVCLGFKVKSDKETEASEESTIDPWSSVSECFVGEFGPWLYSYARTNVMRNAFSSPSVELFARKNASVLIPAYGVIESGHVEYVLKISIGDESWPVGHRYSEFRQLDKHLKRVGVVPSAQLPKKRRFTRSSKKNDPSSLEERRAGLEQYIKSVLEATLEAPHVLGFVLLDFLDPEGKSAIIISEAVEKKYRSRSFETNKKTEPI